MIYSYNYFDFWSRDMAYILGLLIANGNINKNKINFILHSKDKYMLDKIKERVPLESFIIGKYGNKILYKVNFIDKTICTTLLNLFNEFNKGIIDIPEICLSDFIRGYFDGKGNILKIKNQRINITIMSGNKNFLDSLINILKDKANIKNKSYDKFYSFYKFGKKDSIKIGNYIYKDNPELFLLRKRKKFGSLICI